MFSFLKKLVTGVSKLFLALGTALSVALMSSIASVIVTGFSYSKDYLVKSKKGIAKKGVGSPGLKSLAEGLSGYAKGSLAFSLSIISDPIGYIGETTSKQANNVGVSVKDESVDVDEDKKDKDKGKDKKDEDKGNKGIVSDANRSIGSYDNPASPNSTCKKSSATSVKGAKGKGAGK